MMLSYVQKNISKTYVHVNLRALVMKVTAQPSSALAASISRSRLHAYQHSILHHDSGAVQRLRREASLDRGLVRNLKL